MCGEKLTNDRLSLAVKGSPPRVRGKGQHLHEQGQEDRITPACAGKSPAARARRDSRWDHPRVCGEKSADVMTLFWTGGSPPRVRGKEFQCCRDHHPRRITPRVCGEKPHRSCHHRRRLGSPPRVRGKGFAGVCTADVPGITPACAGKSWRPVLGLKCSRDHPRVCGEKDHTTDLVQYGAGSPPRVRGKERSGHDFVLHRRITPACAGKSHFHQCRSCQTRDHPRVCGEKSLLYLPSPFCLGSPPRVRGKVCLLVLY